MKDSRVARINDEIMREVAGILRGELKDPRIGAMASVMKVDTTNDLKYCKVYVSVMGDADQKKSVMEGLKNAAGFVRREVAVRINLRATPQFTFILDDTLEYSMKIEQMIKDIHRQEGERVQEHDD